MKKDPHATVYDLFVAGSMVPAMHIFLTYSKMNIPVRVDQIYKYIDCMKDILPYNRLKVLLLFMFIGFSCSHPKDDPEKRFVNPPAEVRPYGWWHWMGSNFSLSTIRNGERINDRT